MKKILVLLAIALISCKRETPKPDTVAPADPVKAYESALKTTKFGNSESGKYYDVRGFKMYCETYGQGEPILMIHGNGGDVKNFVMQIGYFSKKYKVIVPDSRAQGKSIDTKDSLSYEMMADDLSELLRQMNIKKVDVIGWSDGGINALLLADRHPEQVKKLAITGANAWPDETAVEPDEWKNMQKGFREAQAKVKSGQANDADSLSYKLQKLMAENPHISPDELSKITAPTLVISGDRDMIRPEHTLAIFRALPNAQLWILPDSGHATLISFADEFNAKIDLFFRSEFRKRENERFF